MSQEMKEFQRGVKAGYNSIKPNVVAPTLSMPSIPANTKPYDLGYRKGVEAAKR